MIRPLLLTLALAMPSAALATTGPGCLKVVNVAANDALNLRAGASANSRIVDRLVPGAHGILKLEGPCTPKSIPWGQRWCKVTHYSGSKTTKGFVKARFIRDADCP